MAAGRASAARAGTTWPWWARPPLWPAVPLVTAAVLVAGAVRYGPTAPLLAGWLGLLALGAGALVTPPGRRGAVALVLWSRPLVLALLAGLGVVTLSLRAWFNGDRSALGVGMVEVVALAVVGWAWPRRDADGGDRTGAVAPEVPPEAPFPRRLRDLPRRTRVLVAVIVAAVVLAGAVAVVGVAREGAVVVGDEALIAIEAREAPRDHPLVGKVTSAVLYGNPVDTNNPGPIEFWTASPFVTLLGLTLGSWVYAATVNLAALLAAAWAAFRRGGGRWALVVLVGGLVMFERTVPGLLTSPLNTRIVVLPLFAALVVAGMVALGDAVLLPLLALLATAVVQTHVGYGLITLVAVGVAVACLAARRWRGAPTTAVQAPAALAGLVLALLWFPPVLDQVTGSGNLARLATADIPAAGVSRAAATVAAMVNLPLLALHPGELQPGDFAPPGLLTAVLLALAGALFLRRRGPRLRHHGELLVVAGAAVVAATVTGGLVPTTDAGAEHFSWLRLVAAFVVVAVVLAALPEAAPAPRPPPRWALLLGGAALTFALVLVARPRPFTTQEERAMAAVHDLGPAAAERAEASGGEVVVEARGSWMARSTADGLWAHLLGRGDDVTPWTATADARSVVVVTDGPARSGTLLARSEGEDPGADVDRYPDELAAWARAQGPPVLAGPGRLDLAGVLDGTEPALCVARVREDPAALLDGDPDRLAQLWWTNQVVTPALPPPWLGRSEAWSLSRPIELWAGRPGARPGSDLLLSADDCG